MSAHRNAFSLLELVIVLAITASLSAVGLLKYSSALVRFRIDQAVARISADIRAAQSQARATGSKRVIRFLQDPAGYTIRTVAEDDAGRGGTWVPLAGGQYSVAIAVSGLTRNALVINGFGYSPEGGSVLVRAGTASAELIIEAETGRTYVAR